MRKMTKIFFIPLVLMIGGCSGFLPPDAGKKGEFLNDFLPDDSILYRAVSKRESKSNCADCDVDESQETFDYRPLYKRVECSRIKEVAYYGEGLRSILHSCEYGCEHHPHPVTGYWLSPSLYVWPISESDAMTFAKSCGVHYRNEENK